MKRTGHSKSEFRRARQQGAAMTPARHAVIASLPAAAAMYPIARASRARQATEEFHQ